jgi:RES domain-containing protein
MMSARERLALRAALTALGSNPLRTLFFRNVGEAFRHASLSGFGSFLSGGRYNRGAKYNDEPFDTLYLADSHPTGLAEVGAIVAGVSQPLAPRVLLSVEVILSRVIDITRPAAQALIGVSPTELCRDWRIPQIAGRTTTQEIGNAALHLGLEGILVPSSKSNGNANLVVLTDNMQTTSRLSVFGSGAGGKVYARDVLMGRR